MDGCRLSATYKVQKYNSVLARALLLAPKHLVLLPGLDGTGELFVDFVAALPESCTATKFDRRFSARPRRPRVRAREQWEREMMRVARRKNWRAYSRASRVLFALSRA